jgi:hypothetical protein
MLLEVLGIGISWPLLIVEDPWLFLGDLAVLFLFFFFFLHMTISPELDWLDEWFGISAARAALLESYGGYHRGIPGPLFM